MKPERVLLFAAAGIPQARAAARVTIMTAVFLMMLFGDAQVVPEAGPYWFLNASRTFSSSSRLEMRTCLGFEPS